MSQDGIQNLNVLSISEHPVKQFTRLRLAVSFRPVVIRRLLEVAIFQKELRKPEIERCLSSGDLEQCPSARFASFLLNRIEIGKGASSGTRGGYSQEFVDLDLSLSIQFYSPSLDVISMSEEYFFFRSEYRRRIRQPKTIE